MRKTLLIVVLFLSLALVSCTDHSRTRSFGGELKIELKPNMKLVTAYWDNDDLFIHERAMRPNESPEIHRISEYSSFGLFESSVVITESRK